MKVVAELASALDLVRARAAGVLDANQLEDIDDIVDRVDERRGFPGDIFVVALAGGTGAGKSSLLNALAGEDVASVSAVRPHTNEPMALVPEEPSVELEAFLDDLGITDRVVAPHLSELAIVDLPDQDSVAHEHRELVWAVLPEVDAIVWVADPDKYHDTTFLDDYVAGLAAYQDQALFVLNKADLLSDDAREDIKADFLGQLEVRGIVEPTVFVIAASPPHSVPVGVDELTTHLSERMEAKKVLASKTVADVAHAVSLVARRAGLFSGGALGYEDRWATARSQALEAIEARDGTAAMSVMDDFVASLVGDVTPSLGRRIVAAVPPTLIEQEVEAALAQVAEPEPAAKKKRRRRRKEAAPSVESLPEPAAESDEPSGIDDMLGAPLRALVWDRAYLAATLTAVAVQAAQAQSRLSG